MHINLQIKILVWSYALLWILQMALFFNLAVFVRILYKAESWRAHSNSVKVLEAEVKNAFLEAETKGRYATFDEDARQRFIALSENSLSRLDGLISTVSDSPTQLDNARVIAATVRERFATQHRSIQAAQFVDGKLQSNPTLALEGINAQNRTLYAFAIFEAQEDTLLLERLQSVSATVWNIARIFITLIILNIIASSTAFAWTWTTLKKMRRLARTVESKVGHKESADEITLPVSVVQNWIEELRQT